jgi:hypothetical protein
MCNPHDDECEHPTIYTPGYPMTDEQDAGLVMPAQLAELLSEPGWMRNKPWEDWRKRMGPFLFVRVARNGFGKFGVGVVFVAKGPMPGWGVDGFLCASHVHELDNEIRRIERALAGDAAQREAGEAVK